MLSASVRSAQIGGRTDRSIQPTWILSALPVGRPCWPTVLADRTVPDNVLTARIAADRWAEALPVKDQRMAYVDDVVGTASM
jgi:hypothetical protein